MKIKYRALNPDGGYIESFNRDDLPQDWEIIEIEVEDNNEDVEELRRQKTNEINALYNQQISSLVTIHIENMIFDETPIPQEIRDQRQVLQDECAQKISEIDINMLGKPSKTKPNEIISAK